MLPTPCQCRCSRVSIVAVFGGYLDKIPFGSAIKRGLTFRMAQTPVKHYLPQLLVLIEARLEDGSDLYKKFRERKDSCIKIVMKP
jgi:threonine dehydrogenase-like Zn-dependent dehydrogenase